MSFSHFIFTRYNLGLYDNNKIEDKKDWLRKRYYLFTQCAKSVQNQSCKGFNWIVGIDAKTPDKEKELIMQLCPFGTITVTKEISQFFIEQVAPKLNTDWVITQRLDNDDILEVNCVKEIQAAFEEKEEVIDINGRQLDLATGIYYSSGRERPNSPFLSLVERNKDVKTCFYREHSNMLDSFPSRRIEKNLYVQVVHDGCLMNKIKGNEIY